ncbi:Acyl carrier protein phosphodiesterase [Chitinophaga sp. CF118]|uniref:acyl carrier protein phosphodiesterase n=1 Tax=Chitinophaga sp. CF118 TaxID=1884367 RepID=UPI0008E94BCD|nr:ACP phosphodiesterase [Chitinophaga sp. CF118]SFD30171.1 Acyl carrier protein phosphodiesterase [Chitinophaga sp. CF118]
MNYLAHAYLSFHHPALIVGNMIADFVKGNQWQQYEESIQHGIRMHRAIDTFTDQHPATLAAREYFQPSCGRYSAVFIDIVYDHFLATDKTIFTDSSLADFSQQVYQVLQNHHNSLPPLFQQMFHYMNAQNWLYNYRQKEGIYKSFNGIVRRAKYLEVTADAPFAVLENNYDELAAHYRAFFPEIITYVKDTFIST